MWNRAELKGRAKVAFKRNYWKCVLAAFILALIAGSGAAGSASNYSTSFNGNEDSLMNAAAALPTAVIHALVAGIAIYSLLSVILNIFVFNPIEIGGCHFFTNNAYTMASPKDLLAGFKDGRYWRSVGTVFLRDLFIVLWMLLLIVPGIIKAYEYRMVTYLLAEFPSMSRQEAFRVSKEMMRGQKWNAFILDLSFIGWHILTGLTFGILGVFYVQPYVYATDAELYITLRNQYFSNGSYTGM